MTRFIVEIRENVEEDRVLLIAREQDARIMLEVRGHKSSLIWSAETLAPALYQALVRGAFKRPAER